VKSERDDVRVLVLGGRGFIGRNIVAKLQAQGAQVLIGSRYAAEGNVMQVRMQEMQYAEDWTAVLKNVDVVVNSVGILRERKNETYPSIHTFAVESLADACAQLGVRLIHISAIGLTETAKSGFITSKYWGEQAILASGANALIVRPSLLDGEGGYGAKWFRRVATWPLQMVMKSDGLVAPLQVTDLGVAVANLLMNNTQTPNIIELGGSETLSIPAYLQMLRQRSGKAKALQLNAPKWAVRLVSHIFDVLAWTPLSFGHFELMQGYNVPAMNMLPELLGRKPSALGSRSGFIRDNNLYFADKSALTKGHVDSIYY
jgi:NADH dehydrogenase